MTQERFVGVHLALSSPLARFLGGENPKAVLLGEFKGVLGEVQKSAETVAEKKNKRLKLAVTMFEDEKPQVSFRWENNGLSRSLDVLIRLDEPALAPPMILKISGKAWEGSELRNYREFIIEDDIARLRLPTSGIELDAVMARSFDHVNRWGMADLAQAKDIRRAAFEVLNTQIRQYHALREGRAVPA